MIVLKNKLLFLLGICMFVLACNKGNEAEIELLCEKGKLYIDYNQHDSAIVCLTQAKALLNQQTDFTLSGRLYSYLGSIWKSKMDWQRSEFYYNKALEAYRQAGNKTKEAWNMLFLGDVLRLKDKQTSQSLDYYHKALSMNLSNDTLKGNAIQRIGLYYYYRHETDSALRYLKESLNYPYTGKEQSVRLLFTGVAFYEAQQPDSAERYLKLALQHPNGLRQQSGCYSMLHQIATDRNDTAAMAHYGALCRQCSDSIMRMETRMSNRFIDLKH